MNAHQAVSFNTRFRNNQSSQLDLAIVNDKNILYDLLSVAPIGKSDHVVITAKTQLKLDFNSTHRVLKRNFWKADYDSINTYLSKANFNETNINQSKFERFMEVLNQAINIFVPLENVKVNPNKPWLNQKIFKDIERKRKLWGKYRNHPTIENYEIYKTQNNNLIRNILRARVEYEENIAGSNSSKQFFKYIKRSLASKTTKVLLKDSSTDRLISNNFEIGERFAQQFNKVFTIEDHNRNLPALPKATCSGDCISSICFTPEKIKTALGDMKTDSSPGPDDIPVIFLQKCADTISAPLAILLAEFLDTGMLPELWKLSTVTPLFKRGDKYLPSNYRPINLTCHLSKCMEKIVVRELTPFLVQNGTVTEHQHGFLPRRSTTTNLTKCLNDWTKGFDNNEQTDIVYLDFEKAFDKVPHSMLLYKLEHHGVRGQLLKLISAFLTNRWYQVRVNGVLSEKYRVLSGVPQGSVLGPLLFLVYVGDLSWDIKTNIILFADDTKIYANSDNHVMLQQDLTTVESWTKKWMMKLNEEKCTVLSVAANIIERPYILNNTTLKHIKEQKDLGLTITNNLKWGIHINSIVKKANSFMYLIQRAFKDRSVDSVLKLFKSFVRPKLEYGQTIWNPYFSKDIEILERCQRRITKLPHKLSQMDYPARLRTLQLTTLRERRLRGDLIETYKIVQGYYNCTLDIFLLNQNSDLRGHCKKLNKEKCAKLPRKNFLSNRVVYLWNALSESTVSAPSVNAFKNRLDGELPALMSIDIHYGQ